MVTCGMVSRVLMVKSTKSFKVCFVYFFLDIYFVPVVNYLLFNSGDYLGRIFAGLFEKVSKMSF